MKRLMLLTTGGTIASRKSEAGLAPAIQSDEMVEYLIRTYPDYSFHHENLLNLDSSNIQPEEWQLIARSVFRALGKYDGVIITHGTDTMAYTASALSFMIQNVDKSIVITGSQLPIGHPLTDAVTNLHTAVEAAVHGIKGVSVAFNRKIIAGTRAVKVNTMGFDAFESVNAGYLAEIRADGIHVYRSCTADYNPDRAAILQDKLCTDVFILKLLPGTRPEIFDALAGMKYRGIILEAFGTGGLHYINRDLISKLEMLDQAGITVLVCSNCLHGRCDLTIYEVGKKALAKGVLSAGDMTTEAAATKLMWILGQTDDKQRIKNMLSTNYTGEITL